MSDLVREPTIFYFHVQCAGCRAHDLRHFESMRLLKQVNSNSSSHYLAACVRSAFCVDKVRARMSSAIVATWSASDLYIPTWLTISQNPKPLSLLLHVDFPRRFCLQSITTPRSTCQADPHHSLDDRPFVTDT
jgi:hypothetical protein